MLSVMTTARWGSNLPDEMEPHKGQMALLAYDLAPEGTATFRKVLVDYAPQDGPDGHGRRC